jgi:hypothetical protein
MITGISDETKTIAFTPVRIRKSATIFLNADVSKIFPLFGPVREMEWADDWNPEILYGNSDVEEHMVFRTKSALGTEDFYQWIVTKYNSENNEIEYAVSATDRVWFIEVECKSHEESALATVSYTYIGLTESGHQRNIESLDKMFSENLLDWEDAINYYLKTGKKLKN